MLYIDASRYGNIAQKTGVENYSYFLINELARMAPDQITLISPRRVDLPLPQITIPFWRLWTQVRLGWEVWRNKKINNLFIPSHLMPIVYPKKTTITIHDVAFKRFPESYSLPSRLYLDWGAKFAAKHAHRIIVPSETTKKDLIEFYQADPQKISVIPLGFEPNPIEPTDEQRIEIMNRYQLRPNRYFLFIGRIETKKNIATLVKAFMEISSRCPEIRLVLAGKLGVGGEEIIRSMRNPDILITGYIDEIAKQVLLKNALCFVFPSLFEGFGIPLLEAMAANIPIIASKIPSSWEIAKKNAFFFDPLNEKMLADWMEKVATREHLRELMTQNHAETLKQYSWKKCAEETLKILNQTGQN